MGELRCDSQILFGVVDGNTIEVSCKSRRCGKSPGVIVLHKIDLASGEVVSTTKHRDPVSLFARKEKEDAPGHCVPVRDA